MYLGFRFTTPTLVFYSPFPVNKWQRNFFVAQEGPSGNMGVILLRYTWQDLLQCLWSDFCHYWVQHLLRTCLLISAVSYDITYHIGISLPIRQWYMCHYRLLFRHWSTSKMTYIVCGIGRHQNKLGEDCSSSIHMHTPCRGLSIGPLEGLRLWWPVNSSQRQATFPVSIAWHVVCVSVAVLFVKWVLYVLLKLESKLLNICAGNLSFSHVWLTVVVS